MKVNNWGASIRSGLVTICWSLLALSAAAQTEDPSTPAEVQAETNPEAVAALIAQLAAEDFAIRAQARVKLVAQGMGAIPLLELAAKESADPEVRHLATKLIGEIAVAERNLPTLITLNAEDELLKDAIKRIREQIDGPFSLNHSPVGARLTLQVTREPLWNVLREIHRQTGCGLPQRASTNLYIDGEGARIDPEAPFAQQGPFLIAASGARRESTINFGDDQGLKSSLSLGLHVFIEPKVRLVPDQDYLVIEEAIDGGGRDITKELLEGFHDWKTNYHGGCHCSYQIPIPEPRGPVKKIAKLRGHVPFLVETETREIVVPRLLDSKGRNFRSDDWNILIEDVSWKGSTCSVKLKATYRSPGDAPKWREKIQPSNFKILSADGSAMTRSGGSWSTGPGKMQGSFRFRPAKEGAKASPPDKLLYTYTFERKEITLPFEFKDLPLP